jgi:hypothetical protein
MGTGERSLGLIAAFALWLLVAGQAFANPPTFSYLANPDASVVGFEPPIALATDTGGRVWFAQSDGLGFLDARGDMHFVTHDPFDVNVFAGGPAGSAWIETLDGHVERVWASGRSVTGPAVPYAPSTSAAADGSLWVASGDAEVLRVTPSGVGREFPVPWPVWSVAAAGGGGVWLGAHARIALLSAHGALRSWRLSTPGYFEPAALTATRDGVWAAAGNDTVGHLTSHGRWIVYRVGRPVSSLIAGPDDAVWFADPGHEDIGRIDAAGHVQLRSLRPLTALAGISERGGAKALLRGPGSTLFLTLTTGIDLARMSLNGQCSVPQLVGRDLARARSVSRTAGCALASTPTSGDFIVTSQSAPPGALLPRGASVRVAVRRGAAARAACVAPPYVRQVEDDGELALLERVEVGDVSFLVCVHGADGVHAAPAIPAETSSEYTAITTGDFALAGRYVAWLAVDDGSYGGGPSSIGLLNASTGTLTEYTGEAPGQEQLVTLALDSAGHLAWRALSNLPCTPPMPTPCRVSLPGSSDEIVAALPTGPLVLDTAPAGSLGPLSFSPAGTLHWTDNGQPRSYTFP